jgi:SAM-dependent methyltransferase
MPIIEADWYDYPQYFDLAFRDETTREAKFIDAACRKHCDRPVRRLLEPACGTGRLVAALAAKGYELTGFDLSPSMLDYCRRRLEKRGLKGDLFLGNMAEFQLPRPVDAAFCTFNSFRHLLTEGEAQRHLECVAASLRPGGIYILGLHVFPPDASDQSHERWTAVQGKTKLTVTIRVDGWDRRRRREVLKVSYVVRKPSETLRLRSEFPLRTYTARQLRTLLAKVPAFAIAAVYDFWYELDKPLALNDDIADTVLILKKQ